MPIAYIAVGSNLGNRKANIDKARSLLESTFGQSILRSSELYETNPVGGPAQGKYLNGVWEISTYSSPRILLEEILDIEERLGRKRTIRNAPRIMDLDILFYDDLIISENGLDIPHPRLHQRSFVLKPLVELCPYRQHPVLKKTVAQLLKGIHASCL